VVGTGCNGLAGPLALTPVQWPFAGGAFRGLASGMFVNSVGLAVAGTSTPAIPLPGSPGCNVYLNPLASELTFPTAGTAPLNLPVPNTTAVVGLQLRVQMASVEFGPTTRIATTNAIDLTVGGL
jgi:hypothetical protein